MTTSRGQLKGTVLRFLNKTDRVRGFYSDAKLDDAIQEALDYVAVEMFVAGDGWLTKLMYFNTTNNLSSLTLPGNVALIREVRYKVGDTYYPLTYNDQSDQISTLGSGEVQRAATWRLVGRDIVFDPQLSEGGERYLQIECVTYPAMLVDDSDIVDPQFDRAMLHYVKYKICSVLAGSLEKEVRTWSQEESEWFEKMQTVVNRRNLKSTRIREFL